jgi:hypothetical protein
MKRAILVLLVAVAMLCGARQAYADGITYTESVTGWGSIGGTIFTNALVTITFVGNTSNVAGSAGSFTNSAGTASITIGGMGTFAFTDSLYVFDNLSGLAGMSDATNPLSILDTRNSVFSAYNLATAIGPISGTSAFNLGTSFGTSGGSLILTSLDANSTFTATTDPAPEPSSLLLLGTAAIAGLVIVRRRLL